MKKIFKTLKILLNRTLTPVNVSKAIVIFFVGFISRYFINDYYDINVFKEYLTLVSITFYSVFAAFVVFINELFSFFNINLIPSFIWSIFSTIYIVIDYIFIKPFIWISSKVWGKNVPILYMNEPRTSNSSSVYVGNNYDHYSNIGNSNRNSYYNQIAVQNPYNIEYSSLSRVPNPTHYPLSNYDPNYDQGFTSEYVDHNTSQYYSYNQTPNTGYQEDSTRFFCIDSIHDNGVDRNFYTPSNDPNAPQMSNATTPYTMTPLFGSSEQVSQQPNSSQDSIPFTNDTTHGTIGSNFSESHINWPARRQELFRVMQVEGQWLKEEIHMPSPHIKGKVSIGIEYQDSKSNIQSLYIKYKDLAKRKFFWNIWEKGRNNYDSYEEFKKNFDPKMNIWKEISKTTKSELSKEIHNLLKTDPFGTKHSTIAAKDIKKVNYTTAQARLHEINARRNKSVKLPRKQ
uniref:Uncharacterized protein n=1 Tax=Epichloe typhina TaxID=5113 RepID=A0A1J0D003_EPITY|nr:hypothetical protein [Epichloe typhina]APB96733.1 hypothetical protein [Epichloe typhina]